MEVARRERPDPVQRPAAAARRVGEGHPLAPHRRHAARRRTRGRCLAGGFRRRQAAKAVDPELEAKRKKAEQEDAAKAKADEQRVAAAKAENCKRAREQIRTLESGMRMARVNEKGEREVLDDKMRADEMKRARDLANADCAK